MSKPSPLSRSSSSESLVESSDDETSKVEEPSKSTAPPIMKPKTKKSDQWDTYKGNVNANTNVSSTYTEKFHDICRNFKKVIDTARKLKPEKNPLEKFAKKMGRDGVLAIKELSINEIQELAEWLKANPKAKNIKINLGYKHLGYEFTKDLADMLKTNKTVTTIHLGENRFGEESLKVLAEAFETNTTITSLDLSHCGIYDEGAKLIAKMLKTNTTITTLNLCNNGLVSKSAEEIVSAIIANPKSKITTVNFAVNDIDSKGAISIVKAVIDNSNNPITAINLSHNAIDDAGVEAIAKILIANPDSKITALNMPDMYVDYPARDFIKIIDQQCALNAQRALIENNIAAALDLTTAQPNPNDGNVTSVPDVNDLISQKLFALDKAGKLNTDEVINNPNSVFNKYT